MTIINYIYIYKQAKDVRNFIFIIIILDENEPRT